MVRPPQGSVSKITDLTDVIIDVSNKKLVFGGIMILWGTGTTSGGSLAVTFVTAFKAGTIPHVKLTPKTAGVELAKTAESNTAFTCTARKPVATSGGTDLGTKTSGAPSETKTVVTSCYATTCPAGHSKCAVSEGTVPVASQAHTHSVVMGSHTHSVGGESVDTAFDWIAIGEAQ